jgi:hypothetical protein
MTQRSSNDDLIRRRFRSQRERGGFKTVVLNPVGWSALIGAGMGLGVIVALATPVHSGFALPAGVVVTWILLLVLDHHRWRNSMIHLANGSLDPTTGASIVAQLQRMGIAATYHEETYEDDERPFTQRGIVCRQADAETVRRVLDHQLS